MVPPVWGVVDHPICLGRLVSLGRRGLALVLLITVLVLEPVLEEAVVVVVVVVAVVV